MQGFTDPQHAGALFHDAPVGLAYLDWQRKFVEANGVVSEFLGYSATELRSLRWRDVAEFADATAFESMAQELEAGEIPGFQMVGKFARKEGKTVWACVHSLPVRDDAGHLRHLVVWLLPLPTERDYVAEQNRDGAVQLRSRVSLAAWVKDNPVAALALGLFFLLAAQLHPGLIELLTRWWMKK